MVKWETCGCAVPEFHVPSEVACLYFLEDFLEDFLLPGLEIVAPCERARVGRVCAMCMCVSDGRGTEGA